MATEKFICLWVEENYNYRELGPILLNYGVRSEKRFGQGIKSGLAFGKKFHAEFYLPEGELKREAENWYAFLMDKEKSKMLLEQIKTASDEVFEQIRILLHTNLEKLDNKELWTLYDTYSFKLGRLFGCYIVSQPHRVAKLEGELFEYLKQQGVKDIFSYVSILTAPKKKFNFLTAGNQLFKSSFAETIGEEESKIDRTLINKEFYTEEDASQAERDAVLRELCLPEKLLRIADILRTLAHERFKMRFVWMPALYYGELFLIEIKRRFGVSKEELRAYDTDEVEALICSGKKVDKAVLEKRRELGFLKILEDSELSTLEGEPAQRYLTKIVGTSEDVDEIRGTVASMGYAKGRVVVLSYKYSEEHLDKIKKMQIGDILVSEMTRPNIISACEKAGAIITDEGGTLCHAAIVSRELSLPCIVGTRVATKVLKDGDFIEVDANKGIVRKISGIECENKNLSERKSLQVHKLVPNKNLCDLPEGNISWLADVNRESISIAGGKGAGLGELASLELPVPEAFIVTTNAFDKFAEANKIQYKLHDLFDGFDSEDVAKVEERSMKARAIFAESSLPDDLVQEILAAHSIFGHSEVAVRSSGIAEDLEDSSFAGQHDTFLNVNKNALLEAIKKCFASLYTVRAIHYRHRKNFTPVSLKLAVVVQSMIKSKLAGVMFTTNPITKDKDEIVIEVVSGLGEKLVSGQITPSRYVLMKNGAATAENIEFDAKLSESQLNELANYGKIIENHYGRSMDIEFAIDENDKIFILQARPVTA